LQPAAAPVQVVPAHLSPLVHASPSLQALPAATAALVQVPVLLQLSVVQALPSSHLENDTQDPALQTSPLVQASPSLQNAPLARTKVLHLPVAGSHASLVQALPSSQLFAMPTQTPKLVQASFCVQAEPSSQVLLSALPVHLPLTQLSAPVQVLLSSHGVPLVALPLHTPSTHASAVVQALSSSHRPVPGE
jgi:hypothetical protein